MNATTAAVAFVEYKFAGLPSGEFEGYGAVFGNVDGHGDIIEPGAFAEDLQERKAAGRSTLPMHVQHGLAGDGLPIGTWRSIEEDGRGLRVRGKIAGMQTQTGRMHFERLKDGAYGGLSIGFRTVASREPTSAERARGARRILRKLKVREISLVDDPSNPLCRIDGELKSRTLRELKSYARMAAADPLPTRDDRAALLRVERVMERRAAMKAHPAGRAMVERDIAEALKGMADLPFFPFGTGATRDIHDVLAELAALSGRMEAR